MRSLLQGNVVSVPFFVWPVAIIVGIGIAAGSLSYTPYGRINILWTWLIWAGLPALGTLVSILLALGGSDRPWLFRWGHRSIGWYPTRTQRLRMLWLVQMFWCMVAVGLLLGYLGLLLFSDLAFGWSSTLLRDAEFIARAVGWLALPWQSLWPSAVPEESLIITTQFQRIVPLAGDPALAGQWWRFLMASLLFYNLLPRVVLAIVYYGRWQWSARPEFTVRGGSSTAIQPSAGELREEGLDHWQSAVHVSWEYPGSGETIGFGNGDWREDEAAMAKLLEQCPDRLVWQVKAERSPVAELGDLIARASAGGIKRQAVWVRTSAATDPARHLASWRGFARQHHLVWLTDQAGH